MTKPLEVCTAVKPGKKNATIFGCIREAGHKGPHINGRNEGWLNATTPAKLRRARHESSDRYFEVMG